MNNINTTGFPPPPLQPGWETAIDPVSGRQYFANRVSGETRWDPPPMFPHPPPPPPDPAMQPPFTQMHQVSHQQFPPQSHQYQYHEGGQSVIEHLYLAQPAVVMPMSQNQNMQMMQSTYPQPSQQVNPIISTQKQQSHPISASINNTLSSGLGSLTVNTPGLLVLSVRAMINAENMQKLMEGVLYLPPKLELEGLSAGAIADICNITRYLKARNVDGGDFANGSCVVKHTDEEEVTNDEVFQPYTPLRPFELPVSSVPPRIEEARLEIRLQALHRALNKIA